MAMSTTALSKRTTTAALTVPLTVPLMAVPVLSLVVLLMLMLLRVMMERGKGETYRRSSVVSVRCADLPRRSWPGEWPLKGQGIGRNIGPFETRFRGIQNQDVQGRNQAAEGACG
jgi:hypothetical protein